MERSKPEPDNLTNGVSHSSDEQPTHAKGPPGEDYGWLRSVVENSSEIVTVVDVDGTLRYASPAFGPSAIGRWGSSDEGGGGGNEVEPPWSTC